MKSKISDSLIGYLKNKQIFEQNVCDYFNTNYFQYLYQSLYYSLYISLTNYSNCPAGYLNKLNRLFSKKIKFNDLFTNNNFIMLLNDIYSTRLSSVGIDNLKNKLKNYTNWSDYEGTLQLFQKCNPTKNSNKDAISLGTKVLHVYDPMNNPIVDGVILKTLDLKKLYDNNALIFCVNFQSCVIKFSDNKSDYFELSKETKTYLKKISINHMIPRMKLLDISLLDDTGLMYFKARYYDPAVGRFITADPTIPNPEKSQLFNRYMFVAGSPIQLMDTSGFEPENGGGGETGGGYGGGVSDSSSSGGKSGGSVISSGCAAIAGAMSSAGRAIGSAVGAVKDMYNGTKDWISAGVTKSGNSLSNRISAAQIRREVGVERGTPALKVTSVVTGNIGTGQRLGMEGYEDMEYVDENGIYSKTRIEGVKWQGTAVPGQPYEQPTNEGKGSTMWNEATRHKINVVWGAGYESNENLVRIHTGNISEGCFVFGNLNTNGQAKAIYDSVSGKTQRNISVGLLHTVIDSRSLSEIGNRPITQNKSGF